MKDTPEPTQKIIVELADGKERSIRYLAATTYGHEGRQISAHEFMQQLFGDLGKLVASEDDLRAVWSDPDQRNAFQLRLTAWVRWRPTERHASADRRA